MQLLCELLETSELKDLEKESRFIINEYMTAVRGIQLNEDGVDVILDKLSPRIDALASNIERVQKVRKQTRALFLTKRMNREEAVGARREAITQLRTSVNASSTILQKFLNAIDEYGSKSDKAGSSPVSHADIDPTAMAARFANKKPEDKTSSWASTLSYKEKDKLAAKKRKEAEKKGKAAMKAAKKDKPAAKKPAAKKPAAKKVVKKPAAKKPAAKKPAAKTTKKKPVSKMDAADLKVELAAILANIKK